MAFKKGQKGIGGRPQKPIRKIPMSVYVLPKTKDYFLESRVKGGDILDDYVKEKK